MSDGAAIECRGLTHSFQEGALNVDVLDNVDVSVDTGERVAIVGVSGSGKSTLLHLLGGLDKPTSGEVWVSGTSMSQLGEAARGRLRNQALGFVYQFHHLLPEFSALENVAMPLLLRRDSISEIRAAATELLERVGLADRLTHRPGELSGGERQRAAVARALITRPSVVLADEPTGNLDVMNKDRVLDILIEYARRSNATLLTVTHDRDLLDRFERIVDFKQFYGDPRDSAVDPGEAQAG